MCDESIIEAESRSGQALPESELGVARQICRGVCRSLAELGYATLTEFILRSGRRVDVIGLNSDGSIVIIEIKSGPVDYRSDSKWPEYLDFCDQFYFAVAPEFPRELLPEDCGLIVADAYGAEILREAPLSRLNGSRRRAQTLRFARAAAGRLHGLIDPLP